MTEWLAQFEEDEPRPGLPPRPHALVLADLRRAAAEIAPGRALSSAAYGAWARTDRDALSESRVLQRFGNSWTRACREAGVRSGAPASSRVYGNAGSEERLWQVVAEYLADPDRSGSYHDFAAWLRERPDLPSAQTFRNRLGSWAQVKREAPSRARQGRVDEGRDEG